MWFLSVSTAWLDGLVAVLGCAFRSLAVQVFSILAPFFTWGDLAFTWGIGVLHRGTSRLHRGGKLTLCIDVLSRSSGRIARS